MSEKDESRKVSFSFECRGVEKESGHKTYLDSVERRVAAEGLEIILNGESALALGRWRALGTGSLGTGAALALVAVAFSAL